MSQAHEIMREHGIRHLPVLDAGKLVGMVSQRDLYLIESLPGGDPEEIPVEDAMSEPVYVVAPEAPVDDVVEHMADHKLGSAVIVNRRGVVEGVFTTVDALQAFSAVLRRAVG